MTSDRSEAEADEPESEPPPLILEGNGPRWFRGGCITVLGTLLTMVFAMAPSSPRVGVPLVAFGCVVVALGLLDLIGSFDDPEERVATRVVLMDLALPLCMTAGGAFAFWIFVCRAVNGAFGELHAFHKVLHPAVLPGIFITTSFLVMLVGAGLFASRAGILEGDRPLWKRHGLWLLVFATLLLLPTLGSHSLIDPWETHYGEVSREILARDDWVSLWWAQENWFWSKPVLDFWIQAISMVVFGVRYEPGRMLSAVSDGGLPYPEWAMRMPIFLITLGATYLFYRAIASVWGRRAGLVTGVVLTTMPQWFFIAHQTMTDMPFVAPMTGAMALVILGLHAKSDRVAKCFEIPLGPVSLRLSAFHLVMGTVLLVSLPQICYLLSKNIAFNIDPRWGMRYPPIVIVRDTFMSGSAGNCGLPGNEACTQVFPVLPRFQPALQALLWIQALALLLYMNWGERRVRRLYFLGAWFLASISTMGKGPAGLVIPVAAIGAHLVVTRKYEALLDMEIASGCMIVLAVAFPWFIAMYARHGEPFVDRLFFHDMYNRAFDHVHDTNQGDDVSFRYFVWQLGYAMFPWVGIAPLALLRVHRGGYGALEKSTSQLLLLWALLGFTLFSLIETKFHHYIFPIVPAIAGLVGVYANEMLEKWRRAEPHTKEWLAARYEGATLGMSAFLGAGLVLLVGRDFAAKRPDQPSDARLISLFSYNYEREWPSNLDFSKVLWVFTFLLAGLLLVASWSFARRYAMVVFGAAAAAFTVFCLDDYFMQAAQHWGQRETAIAYLRESKKIPGPIISYQQNWKGENFYFGNHIASFPVTGQPFREYIAELRRIKKQKTFYFFVIPNRVSALSSELNSPKDLTTLTPLTLNNKFVLVRATID